MLSYHEYGFAHYKRTRFVKCKMQLYSHERTVKITLVSELCAMAALSVQHTPREDGKFRGEYEREEDNVCTFCVFQRQIK